MSFPWWFPIVVGGFFALCALFFLVLVYREEKTRDRWIEERYESMRRRSIALEEKYAAPTREPRSIR